MSPTGSLTTTRPLLTSAGGWALSRTIWTATTSPPDNPTAGNYNQTGVPGHYNTPLAP